MKKKLYNLAKNLKAIFIVYLCIAFVLPTNIVHAKTSAEIQQEIDQKQQELQKTQDELNKAKADYDSYENALVNSQGGLPALQAEISKIDSEIEYNNLQKELLDQSKKIKELEKAQREEKQRESVKDTYIDWRVRGEANLVQTINSDKFDAKKVQEYSNSVIIDQEQKILGLATELVGINNNITDFQKKLDDLSQKNADLQTRKKQVEDEIAYYNSQIYASSSSINNLQSNVKTIQSNITSLSQEQKAALQEEAEIIAASGGPGASISGCGTYDDNNNGLNTINFCGLGNDFTQGHGVGMSQWGANGMALHGFSASDILKFYYTGVEINGGYEGRTVNAEGYGNINIEDYVAGQGEVPGRACGTQAQAAANPAKYVVDNPNSAWDCWPEESIKAQAIAFRTYGIYNSGFVHTDARSQVYNGTHYTQWAADETRGQVVTYGGSPIEAMYSADNNQGFGTADKDTMFQGYSGDGTIVPYLKSVNDSSYATPTAYTYWGYKTDNYTTSDIIAMMDYVINNPGSFGGFSGYLSGVKNTIGGSIGNISMERDLARRVKKVWIKGDNGNSASIGGYWFTYMWNIYAYRVRGDTSKTQWLWSQTFFLHIV